MTLRCRSCRRVRWFIARAARRVQAQIPGVDASALGVILDSVAGYREHYREPAATEYHPKLDPARSRGGIHESELAIDVMSAYEHAAPTRDWPEVSFSPRGSTCTVTRSCPA